MTVSQCSVGLTIFIQSCTDRLQVHDLLSFQLCSDQSVPFLRLSKRYPAHLHPTTTRFGAQDTRLYPLNAFERLGHCFLDLIAITFLVIYPSISLLICLCVSLRPSFTLLAALSRLFLGFLGFPVAQAALACIYRCSRTLSCTPMIGLVSSTSVVS